MTKKELNDLVVAFALLGGWCFIVGIASPMLIIGSVLFGSLAAVAKLFENVAEN